MLDGLMSRWVMPHSCSCSLPSSVWHAILYIKLAGAPPPCRLRRPARPPRSVSSMTMWTQKESGTMHVPMHCTTSRCGHAPERERTWSSLGICSLQWLSWALTQGVLHKAQPKQENGSGHQNQVKAVKGVKRLRRQGGNCMHLPRQDSRTVSGASGQSSCSGNNVGITQNG